MYNNCNYNVNGTFVCKNIIEPLKNMCYKCITKDLYCNNTCKTTGTFSITCNKCRQDAAKCKCK
jgi:hypothetical protein